VKHPLPNSIEKTFLDCLKWIGVAFAVGLEVNPIGFDVKDSGKKDGQVLADDSQSSAIIRGG
jgi:hypothetical protein